MFSINHVEYNDRVSIILIWSKLKPHLIGIIKLSFKKTAQGSNATARITLRMPRTEHTTPFLRMLHWLPIFSRIAYTVDSICHTPLTTAYPKYLLELLTVYTHARPLHSSSDPNILNVATTRTKSYGQRTFAYKEPSNWNRIPGEVRRIEDTFRSFHQQD